MLVVDVEKAVVHCLLRVAACNLAVCSWCCIRWRLLKCVGFCWSFCLVICPEYGLNKVILVVLI